MIGLRWHDRVNEFGDKWLYTDDQSFSAGARLGFYYARWNEERTGYSLRGKYDYKTVIFRKYVAFISVFSVSRLIASGEIGKLISTKSWTDKDNYKY